MKKTVFIIALAAMAALLAVACQKDNARPEPQPVVVQPQAYPTGSVTYTIGRETNTRTVDNAGEWHELLAVCLDGADEGHLVTIAHQEGGNPAKERLTYVTESREAALAWVDSRFNEGYDVTLWYDSEEGKYICVATKSTSTGSFVAPNGFTYQPLEQYIIGNWEKCLNYKTELKPGASSIPIDHNVGIVSLSWEQIYDFCMIAPTSGVDSSTYRNLIITTDSITMVDDYSHYSISYEIQSDIIHTTSGNPDARYKFRAFEWNTDTMLAYYNRDNQLLPTIYIRK